MPLLPTPVIDYTDKDFDALRLRLTRLVRSVFPTWSDYNVANFGNILLELFAHIGDVLGYYQDNQADESKWSTARLRTSLLALVKMIGYTPATAHAATALETFSIPAPVAGTVTIPAGQVVRTKQVTDPIVFQLLAEVVIAAGATSATGIVEHSESHEEVTAATGLADQAIVLPQTPFLDGSESVVADNGAYSRVTDLLDSASDDRHYTVTIDQNDRATIRFGTGVKGQLPEGTITTGYKTGGGEDGNVEAGAIAVIDGTFTDSFSTPVRVSVTNVAPASGGAARESAAKIRLMAPRSLRTLTRTVAREDFETQALRVNGVARALMLTSNEDTTIDENSGFLFLVPTGGGTASQALIDEVDALIRDHYPPTVTFRWVTLSAQYETINVSAVVYFTKGTTTLEARQAVRASIVERLGAWFALIDTDPESDGFGGPNENVDFGYYYQDPEGNPDGTLSWSDIHNVVRDTTGVRKVGAGGGDFTLNGERADVALPMRRFPVLGTVTVIDGDTGETV